MLRLLVPALLLSIAAPAFAADDLLKSIFNGDGPPVTMGTDNPDQPPPAVDKDGSGLSHTGPNDPNFDPDKYIETGGQGDPNDPEWAAWYMQGIGNPSVPDGMTQAEFIDQFEHQCNGEQECVADGYGDDNPDLAAQ